MNQVADEFCIDGRNAMVCGSYEAEKRRYKKYVGKSGRIWLVAIQDNCAANIYVEGGLNSDGFAGRTLEFVLEDLSTVKLKGPWHTNSAALLADTGVDIRDKHRTFVVVARERVCGYSKTILKGILYKDNHAMLGLFDRGNYIAKKLADELGVAVYLFSESESGSSCGPVYPNMVKE